MESMIQQRMDAKGDLLKKLAHLHFVSELLYILRCEEATNKVSKIANCAHCKVELKVSAFIDDVIIGL